MHNVIVIGDANVDIIVPYPRFLNKERTLVDYPTPELQGGGTSGTAVRFPRTARRGQRNRACRADHLFGR